MDALSDVLRVVRLKGGVFLEAEFTAPWCISSQIVREDCGSLLEAAEHLVLYHYVAEGRLTAQVPNGKPVEIGAGEVVIFSAQSRPRARKRCRAAAGAGTTDRARPAGGRPVGDPPRRWRRADAHRVRLPGRLAQEWTVDDLGREVGLSRSALADRFTRLIGEPPMRYLARWRIQRAAHELRTSDMPLARIAEQVGYESEAAFNRVQTQFRSASGHLAQECVGAARLARRRELSCAGARNRAPAQETNLSANPRAPRAASRS
jgi:AraC-like DNA-binding protein